MDVQSTFRVYWTSALPRARRAFTLVEFMLVVAILGVLAALAVPRYQSAVTVARNAVAIREVNLLMNEIDRYKMRRGVLPDTLADIDRGETSDPWGHPYQFVVFDLAFAGRGAGGTNAAEVAGQRSLRRARSPQRPVRTTSCAPATVRSLGLPQTIE